MNDWMTGRFVQGLAVLALLMSGCQRSVQASRAEATQLRATRGNIVQKVVLSGEIAATRGDVITVPKLESWQTNIRWLVEDGILVQKGDRIADLDTTSVTSTLDQKRTALREARSQLAEAEARLRSDVEEKTFEVKRRANELQKAEIAAAVPSELLSSKEIRDRQVALERARIEHEKARTTLESSQTGTRADLENLRLTVESASRDVAYAESSIELLTLRAPSNGLVITGDIPWESRKLQVGDRVWVGFPLARIPDLTSLEIVAQLWDVDDGTVKIGDRATVMVDAYPDRSFQADVVSVAPVAQELARQSRRRAFKVRLALVDVDRSIMRPGYSVRAVIAREAAHDAIIIPRVALDFAAERPKVRLADGALRDVQLGACNALHCAAAGLKEGTQLALAQGETAE